MKIPRKPPPFQQLFLEIIQEYGSNVDFGRFLDIASAPPPDSVNYVHWDKLLYRQPPLGLTHEEWWWGLKNQRQSLYREIELKDKQGRPFRFLVNDAMHEILREADLGTGGHIGVPAQVTNPDTRDQYYISSLIQEAITSSQLEGATTTREVAKRLITEGRKPADRSEQMILNNYLTMREIGTVKEQPLSKELVFKLHRMITEHTLNDGSAAGRFRRDDEDIRVEDGEGKVLHLPPKAEELEQRMQAMCDFGNALTPESFVHPVIRAIILHFWLSYDHPFVDGNGRTARALFYWSMLHGGYWLFEFISISQIILAGPSKYGRAFLYTETDDNDLTYFLDYHLQVIRRSVQALHAYIHRKTLQVRELEIRLRRLAALNHRQRQLITHALRHPRFEYTVESHRASHDVVYQTARTDLLDLYAHGFLEKRKRGKAMIFLPVSDLEQRLQRLG